MTHEEMLVQLDAASHCVRAAGMLPAEEAINKAIELLKADKTEDAHATRSHHKAKKGE